MRVYASDQEEGIQAQETLRDWAASGWISEKQRKDLDLAVDPGLRRVPRFLRAVLFFFTMIGLLSGILLFDHLFEIRGQVPTALMWGLFSVVFYTLGEYLIASRRMYRHGVEEALLVFSVLAIYWAFQQSFPMWRDREAAGLGFLVGAAGSFWLFLRFGYIYGALGAILFLSFLPACWIDGNTAARCAWIFLFGSLGIMAHYQHKPHRDDYLDQSLGFISAVLFFAMYLAFNLRLTHRDFFTPRLQPIGGALLGYPDWFYWATFAAIWIIPFFLCYRSIRQRDRFLLMASILMCLLTLISNKPYLGWTRHTWDPMILGVLLTGIAVAVRRWLNSGPNKQRSGYTAERLSESARQLLSTLGTVSAVWQQPGPGHATPSPKPDLGGGRSGGGGASGSW